MSTQNHGPQCLFLWVRVDFQGLERDCALYILWVGVIFTFEYRATELVRGDGDGGKDRQGLHEHSL